jgi:Ni/Fe-hydrogenase subunit HybB-like protein
MRWLAVWLLLTGVYFAGQLVTPLLTGGGWSYSRESLAHLVTVPLIQVLALRVVALVRRDRRQRRAVPSRPPAAEKSASRPDAGR